MDINQPWRPQAEALGAFIRAQRRLADLSLREMATLTHVSNAYLSQIERGLHQPSVRVLSAIASALDVPPDELLAEAGLLAHTRDAAQAGDADGAGEGGPSGLDDLDGESRDGPTERAILADPRLSDAQRQALLGVYRSFAATEG